MTINEKKYLLDQNRSRKVKRLKKQAIKMLFKACLIVIGIIILVIILKHSMERSDANFQARQYIYSHPEYTMNDFNYILNNKIK